jgi:pimeloyl-ACP methyl ester carboxylesterase
MLNWYPTIFRPDVVAVARPGALVDVGGRKVHINCTGSGQPTVVLEAGSGAFALDWLFVQPEIAKTTRVCSYDRAGLGWSDPLGKPETPDGVVRDLHAALQSAGEKPPYVLVGASIGGLYARAYQLQYPTDVAGLVLVDSAHEDNLRIPGPDGKPAVIWSVSAEQLRTTLERFIPKDMPPPPPPPPSEGAPFDKLPAELLTTRVTFESRFFKTMGANTRDQMLEMIESQRVTLTKLHDTDARQPQPLGNRPIIVLSAGTGGDPEFKATHPKLAQLSTNSSHRTIAGSGHEIHLYQPTAVVRAIQDVVDAVRRGSRLTQ